MSAASTPAILHKFTGTDNPRHLRVIHAALRRSLPREQVDREAGCSNGPELIAELRRRGLEFPCVRIEAFDRDGKPCRPGVYNLTAKRATHTPAKPTSPASVKSMLPFWRDAIQR